MGESMKRARGAVSILATVASIALLQGCGAESTETITSPPLTGSGALGRGCPPDKWSRLVALRMLINDKDDPPGSPPRPYYAAPIHIIVLPTDSLKPRLLLIGEVKSDDVCSPKTKRDYTAFEFQVQDPPASGTQFVKHRAEPEKQKGDSVMCGGHAFLPFGQAFVAGGANVDLRPNSVLGLDYALTFDPQTSKWVKQPEMRGKGEGIGSDHPTARRWYPTVTPLPDGKMFVSSGMEKFGDTYRYNLSTEAFDYRAQKDPWTLLSSHEIGPGAIRPFQYTHVFVLPDPPTTLKEMIMIGDPARIRFYSYTMAKAHANPWSLPAEDVRPQRNGDGISSLLLPFDDPGTTDVQVPAKMLVAGGLDKKTKARRTIDFYDAIEESWETPLDAGIARLHPSTVLLPDGNVLVVNGAVSGGGEGDPTRPQLLDPDTRQICWGSSWNKPAGADPLQRGYHNIAALLPDGRVFVGGGVRDACTFSDERADMRYYSPPYLQRKEPRPTYRGRVPQCIEYRELFDLYYDNQGKPIDEVVMLGVGAMTHSVDMGQRYIRLKLGRRDAEWVEVRAPRDGFVAAPGPYWMFLLREFPGAHFGYRRLPSVAKLVYLAHSCAALEDRFER